ncbi:MAG TPA: lamin tail domain-containing protein [Polyangiales bacterium]|nr:lamin tail domain-containing protein [Polyangiales bacterium]
MLRNPALCVLLTALSCLLPRCALTPDFPAESTPEGPALIAQDARGEPVLLDRLPRRPRLGIALGAPPDAPNSGPWLLTGGSDTALLDDLEKLPLSATHLSRSVAIRHRWDGERLAIEPLDALDPGRVYTLALPRKAALGMKAPLVAELRVDDSAHAGAAVRATFPPAEAASVPTDLAEALISFDGIVHGSASALWIEDDRGFAHPARTEAVDCKRYDSAAISCTRLVPERALEPARRYVLRSGSALLDSHGAVVTELQAGFSTQLDLQDEPATLQATTCAIDELALPVGCALITDERVELQLFQNPGVRVLAELSEQRVAVLPASMNEPLLFTGLFADRTYTLIVETIDGSRHAEQISWPLKTAPVLATLMISEVYADPNGGEPEQEYVELWNFGNEAQSLAGLHLSDDPKAPGSQLPEQASIAPGARALLVSDNFDPHDSRDPAPAPGSLLVRVGKTVTRAGLSNSGERLYLRSADGYRVSTAPAQPTPREGRCLARNAQNSEWSLAECTPGH